MLSTVTTVLVTVVLCFLGLFLLLKFGVRYFFTRHLKTMVAAMQSAAGEQPIAARITMELDKVQFADPLTKKTMAEFKALGYQSAGRYLIPEMPAMQVWAGTHPEDGSLALVMEVREMCVAFDVIRFYENGNVLGSGTHPFYRPEHYPAHIKYKQYPLGTPAATAVEWLRNRPLEAPISAATHENLRTLNTMLYIETMDYKLGLPVPSFEVFKTKTLQDFASIGKTAPELTSAQWRTAYEQHRNSLNNALDEALKDHLLKSGDVSARQWDEVQYDLTFIHERLMDEDIATRALARSEWTPDEPKVERLMNQGSAPGKLFESIQSLLAEDERFVLIGSVNKPISARAYAPAARN